MISRLLKPTLATVLLCLICLSGAATAQLRLPSPEEALSSPGMEKMAGILFSRRFEKGGGWGGKPDILPPTAPESVRVQKIVTRLAESVALDRPNVVFQAKVVRQDEVNAFCIPGGYIYVYTGLIKHIDKSHPENPDDALAAVLGHEIAHAVLRHGLKDWAQKKQYEKILEDRELFMEVLMASSREQEFEADRYGALYAVRAGYAITAAQDVFANFPKSRQIYDRGLSTHPTGEERAAQLERFERQLKTMVGLWDESFKASSAGRFDQASIALEILEAEFPNLPSVHNNLGWAYYRSYEKTDPTPSKEHPAYSFVADLGIKVRGAADGDLVLLNEAKDEFRKALGLNPDMVEAYEGSALCSLELGEFKAASESLKKVQALQPDRPQTLNLLGILAAREGKAEQASNLYQQALKKDKSFAPAHYNLSLAHQALGKTALAEKSRESFLALEPQGYWAEKAAQGLGQNVAQVTKDESLGNVTLGVSRTTLVKALGEPTKTYNSFTELERLDYPQQGLVVWLNQDQVKIIESTRHNPEKTPLKLGDKAEQVRTALGNPATTGRSDQGRESWSYPARGLSVLLKSGEVVGFVVGSSR